MSRIFGMLQLPKDFSRHSNSPLLGGSVTRSAQTYSPVEASTSLEEGNLKAKSFKVGSSIPEDSSG